MFRRWRLRRIHGRYLESSRNLTEGRQALERARGCRLAFLSLVTPMPVMGLMGDGALLLEALRRLEDRCRDERLSEETIRSYHRLLFKKDDPPPGEYRTVDVRLKQSKIAPPAPSRVPALMKQFDARLAQEQERLDAAGRPGPEELLRFAAETHQRLGWIHPFVDGNGRVARLAMNHVLRRYGGPYVILPPLSESAEHFRTIQEAHAGDLEPFLAFARAHRHPV